jgi:hypothetical protein
MHFAAEDYGRHQLTNWGFVPLCAAVRDDPESSDYLYGDSAQPRFVIIGGLLARCDQPVASVGPILANAASQHLQHTTDGKRRKGADKVFNKRYSA